MSEKSIFRDFYHEVPSDGKGLCDSNERVRIEAISVKAGDRAWIDRHLRVETLKDAWALALFEANEAGEVWNKVMDVLATMNYNFCQKGVLASTGVRAISSDIEIQLEIVEKAVEGWPLGKILDASKGFRGHYLKGVAWKCGTGITGKAIKDHFFGNADKRVGLIEKIAENKNLSKELLDKLVIMAFGPNSQIIGLDDSEREALIERVVESGGLKQEVVEELWKAGILRTIGGTRMIVAHPDTSLEFLKKCYTGVMPGEVKVEALMHPKAREAALSWLKLKKIPGSRAIYSQLVQTDNIDGSWIEQIAQVWDVNLGVWLGSALIRHPAVSDKEALRIGKIGEGFSKRTNKNAIRAALATRAAAREDEELGKALRESNSMDVLAGMVEGAQTAKELTRAVKRLKRSSVALLLETLAEKQLPADIKEPQKLLGSVLAKGSQKEREEVIKILGKWGKERGPKI